ncbi:F167A protein, partial [Atractosteus spatula]|nr:F167A protein [Atractosteus spatula]
MELVLMRLRDFSSKSATFNDCKSAETSSFRVPQENCKGESRPQLDIETALAWLRRELMEMRSQDQMLIKQLMDLHNGIQELKLECADLENIDSESDTEDGSLYSSFGEVCSSPASSGRGLPQGLPRRSSSRRSSMP